VQLAAVYPHKKLQDPKVRLLLDFMAERCQLVVNNDIPFHRIAVTKANKAKAEAQIMDIVEETGAQLVVLARYMQILSDEMCQKMSGRSSTSTTRSCPASRAPTPTSRPMSAA
jgi:folate-dependent phosphoribosylglycinamide formyltransferase PurN